MGGSQSENTVSELYMTDWLCPLCKESGIRAAVTIPDYNHGIAGRFSYGSCAKCGLWRQQPRPDDATLGRAYPLHYGSSPDIKLNPGSRINCYANRRRRAFIEQHAGPASSLFDIGCGSGFFLAFLNGKGWRIGGIDSAAEHIEYARTALGLPGVECAQWPGWDSGGKRFGVVSLIHVLEHLPDPVGGLRAAADLLTPGGHLLIETPNVNAFARLVFGGRCNLFDAPRHLCLFSRVTLHSCAVAAGLHPVRIVSYSPALDGYIESLRYTLQDLRIRRYPSKQRHGEDAQAVSRADAAPQPPGATRSLAARAFHGAERTFDRCIDAAACCFGGGLTLLMLARKEP